MVGELADDDAAALTGLDIRDSLVYLAIDENDSRRWDALKMLRKLEGDSAGAAEYASLPPAQIIRSAISMAAQGEPRGHDRKLRKNLRLLLRNTHHDRRPFAHAVTAILTARSPEPDPAELHLALELVRHLRIHEIGDPAELVRAMHRLSAHPALMVSVRAKSVLLGRTLGSELLFEQMLHGDQAVREEARAIFEQMAEPEDRDSFKRFASSRSRSTWTRILRFVRLR
ncbi:hypothetical protein ACQPZP_20850 [Spirillospora sp. CA-142024]|uniref:hypothetical protein n=1 Tax=Spirillospora sp. CA-142024 TaxID=3240036 RepID=UPI003D934113